MLSGKERDRLSTFIISYMRNAMGKGPKDLRVSCDKNVVIARTSGVLTTIEKTYYRRSSDPTLVHQLHDCIFKSAREDFRQFFAAEFGLNLTAMSSETDLSADTRLLIFEIESQ